MLAFARRAHSELVSLAAFTIAIFVALIQAPNMPENVPGIQTILNGKYLKMAISRPNLISEGTFLATIFPKTNGHRFGFQPQRRLLFVYEDYN